MPLFHLYIINNKVCSTNVIKLYYKTNTCFDQTAFVFTPFWKIDPPRAYLIKPSILTPKQLNTSTQKVLKFHLTLSEHEHQQSSQNERMKRLHALCTDITQPCAVTRLHTILSRSTGLQDLSLEWEEVREREREGRRDCVKDNRRSL